MDELAALILLVVGSITFIIAPVAWVFAIVYMFRTVAHRKPGVALWRDAPAMNPFNHILITRNLTDEGLRYRRRLVIAIAAFTIPILLTLAIAALTGNLK